MYCSDRVLGKPKPLAFLAAPGLCLPPAPRTHSSGLRRLPARDGTTERRGRGGRDQCSTRPLMIQPGVVILQEGVRPRPTFLSPPSCSTWGAAPSGALISANILSRATPRSSPDIFEIKAKIISGVAPCVPARDATISEPGRVSHLPHGGAER